MGDSDSLPFPPPFFPLRGCIFVISNNAFKDYISLNPSISEKMDFVIDFLKFSSSCAYICGETFSKVKEQMKGKESSFKYFNTAIKDGGSITGNSTLGSHEKDIVFLAGARMPYEWTCWCGKTFVKNTPQGLGMARSNHLRSHLHG